MQNLTTSKTLAGAGFFCREQASVLHEGKSSLDLVLRVSKKDISLLQSFPECTFQNRQQATDTSPLFYTFLRGCLPQPVHTWSLWGRLCREALPCALPRPSFPSTGIPLSGTL